MGLSLVAFDTDHIQRYVFATNKLREIRGASSLLDFLNRVEMPRLARDCKAQEIYALGGSGLFLAETDRVEELRIAIQQRYRELTGGGASITAVSLPLPDSITSIEAAMKAADLSETLELLGWRLQEEKLHPPPFLALSSHPFLRPCDSCGVEYADASNAGMDVPRTPDERSEQFCLSCQKKRFRDERVKASLQSLVAGSSREDEPMWSQIIRGLRARGYDFSRRPERPGDLNVFRSFKGAKDYIALIYADANNMGRALENCRTLPQRREFAQTINRAMYSAVCAAIARHLKVAEHVKPGGENSTPVFPFDILLLGGDDIYLMVPATAALDVALELARTFRAEAGQGRTLAISVVMAPVKYPFGLWREMAEEALKFAKKESAEARAWARQTGQTIDETRINFLVVTGSSSDFKAVYDRTYFNEDKEAHQEFHATLRPYAPADLEVLLKAIRDPAGGNLGRTKLHQMREAVLRMNLTTSVSDGLATLRNWRPAQRDHVVRHVYEFAGRCQMPHSNPADPVAGFPQVTFPWFAAGRNERRQNTVYRTSLLDFVELYDFLAGTGGGNGQEA